MSISQSSEALDIQHIGERHINPKLMQHHIQRERNLLISYGLQVHLDITNLIQTFASTLQQEIDYAHMNYTNQSIGKEIIIGHAKRHNAEYRLSIDGEDLGTVTLTRSTRFSDDEISEIEEILCCLVYPLRNSLHYHQAIKNSNQDPLTGVTNRTGLSKSLHSEWELAQRHQHDLSLLVIDIDEYKKINDNYGHLCGDLILVEIAEQIKSCIRDSDVIYRYGGDEFLAVLRETNAEGAIILAERIRQLIAKHTYHYKDQQIKVTTSIGLAWNQQQDFSNDIEFLEHADQALYRAKNEGRNVVSL